MEEEEEEEENKKRKGESFSASPGDLFFSDWTSLECATIRLTFSFFQPKKTRSTFCYCYYFNKNCQGGGNMVSFFYLQEEEEGRYKESFSRVLRLLLLYSNATRRESLCEHQRCERPKRASTAPILLTYNNILSLSLTHTQTYTPFVY